MTRPGVALAACGLASLVLAFGGDAHASGEGGHGGGEGLLWPFLNLALLLAVLFYFARKPIQKYFHTRRDTIQQELTDAAEMRDQAEARYAEWQRRLADLEAELDGIRAQARERAAVERDQILADANAAAERIRSDAHTAVQLELRSARRALREEAADLAVELAAERLRSQVDDDDRARLVDEFIERVESTRAEEH